MSHLRKSSVWYAWLFVRFAMPILMGFFLIAVPGSSESAQPESDLGTWHAAAPIPTKRTEAAAAALDGKIYVVGGFEKPSFGNLLNFGITPSVEVYDPATDRWALKAPLPVGLHHVGIAVVDSRLYVIGGYTKSGFTVWNPVATVYAYDPATDRWTERASMPTARGALAVTEHEGKLYAIGGYDRKANNPQVEVYDPLLNTWTTRASLPTPRDHLASAAVAGKIYAIGGRVNGDYAQNLALVERYDPATDRWMRVSDLPTARSGIAAAVAREKIYVFGGEGAVGTFQENEAYDPTRDTWQRMAPMPTARHGLGSAVVQGHIYVISGGPTPGGSFSDLNEVFTVPSTSSAMSE
ncbi:MAG: kelch repeat-containing protein [Nitrospira sp.]|nr:kelch repeat-containing protein [Nitrospira sp.]